MCTLERPCRLLTLALAMAGLIVLPADPSRAGERQEASTSDPAPGAVGAKVLGFAPGPGGEGGPLVVADRAEEQFVLIFVGRCQRDAIGMALAEVSMPRPMTHPLLGSVIRRLGARLEWVRVDSLNESTYFATLGLIQGDSLITVDARPSDAIALATSIGAPVTVAPGLLNAAGMTREELLEAFKRWRERKPYEGEGPIKPSASEPGGGSGHRDAPTGRSRGL
jgi:bifunctional DNase/RNase